MAGSRNKQAHLLSQQVLMQVVSDEDVWFSSPQHRQLSAELAGVCCRGPLPCGQVDESTPVTWQLIRGAAVADAQVMHCRYCWSLVCSWGVHTQVPTYIVWQNDTLLTFRLCNLTSYRGWEHFNAGQRKRCALW